MEDSRKDNARTLHERKESGKCVALQGREQGDIREQWIWLVMSGE